MDIDEKTYSVFPVKEIVRTGDRIDLREQEKPVIGEISLKIYIDAVEYASLLCLNQLSEELALGFLYSESVIDSMDDVASIAYNERLFSVMIGLVPGRKVDRCESLRSVTSGCGRCFTYINPLKQDKFRVVPVRERFNLIDILGTQSSILHLSEKVSKCLCYFSFAPISQRDCHLQASARACEEIGVRRMQRDLCRRTSQRVGDLLTEGWLCVIYIKDEGGDAY